MIKHQRYSHVNVWAVIMNGLQKVIGIKVIVCLLVFLLLSLASSPFMLQLQNSKHTMLSVHSIFCQGHGDNIGNSWAKTILNCNVHLIFNLKLSLLKLLLTPVTWVNSVVNNMWFNINVFLHKYFIVIWTPMEQKENNLIPLFSPDVNSFSFSSLQLMKAIRFRLSSLLWWIYLSAMLSGIQVTV